MVQSCLPLNWKKTLIPVTADGSVRLSCYVAMFLCSKNTVCSTLKQEVDYHGIVKVGAVNNKTLKK